MRRALFATGGLAFLAALAAFAATRAVSWWHDIEMNPQRCVWEDIVQAPEPDLLPEATVAEGVLIERAFSPYHPFGPQMEANEHRVLDWLALGGFRYIEIPSAYAPFTPRSINKPLLLPDSRALPEPPRQPPAWIRYELVTRPDAACAATDPWLQRMQAQGDSRASTPGGGRWAGALGTHCLRLTEITQPQATHQFLMRPAQRYTLKNHPNSNTRAELYMTRLIIGGQLAGRVSARPSPANQYATSYFCRENAHWRRLVFHTVSSPTGQPLFSGEPPVDPVEQARVYHRVFGTQGNLLRFMLWGPAAFIALLAALFFAARATWRWIGAGG